MTGRDLFVTPLIIVILFLVAWFLRPYLSNSETRKFFFPALIVKMIGALAVGFIYQFYYEGGDTFTYYNLGSSHIWDAFLDSPVKAAKLIFGGNHYTADTYEYASRIYSFGDAHSYFVVRVAGLFGLIGLNTYSSIAILFAGFCFSGIWLMFMNLNRAYPGMSTEFAVAILFIPSVFFWGSGLLKDTLTLGALGWLTYAAINLGLFRRRVIFSIMISLIAAYILYVVKIYILLCIIPAILFWFLMNFIISIKSIIAKVIVVPISLAIVIAVGYYSIVLLGETSHRYSIDKFSYTAETTARWNYYVSQQQGGSGYTLGDDYDFSTTAMVGRFPQAVWVALFRPYVWESTNFVMLLSGIENLVLLVLTIYVFFKVGFLRAVKIFLSNSFVFFSLIFVITFAFSIGISTYNFGSLVRYKIPLLPFMISALFILYTISKRDRKLSRLEATE